MGKPPSPLVRGQGNEPFRVADARSAAKRGQTIPYDVNGSPAGGDASTLGGEDGAHYLDRANHTGTQPSTTISDLAEAVQDAVGAMVAAGANISVSYNDGAGTLTISLATSPALTGTPTAPTAAAGTNTTQIATTAYVQTAISNLINSAPGALDTLDELAAALGDDANFAATMTTALAGKQAADALLSSIAGLTFGADSFIYGTGSDTAAAGTVTSAARTLLAQGSQAAMRSTGLGLGSAATQSTGTSGATVPLLNGTNSWSGAQTFDLAGGYAISLTGASTNFRAVRLVNTGASFAFAIESSGGGNFIGGSPGYSVAITTFDANPILLGVNNTEVVRITAASVNVTGALQCDSLRVDQNPTAETPVPTHTFTVSLNGTTYRVPCLV